MPLREVATLMNIDISTLAKIERSERNATKEMLVPLAKILEINPKKIIVTYLSDKIVSELREEMYPHDVLKVAEDKINYLQNNDASIQNSTKYKSLITLFSDTEFDFNIEGDEQVDVWDKSVKVEENGYYYKGEPIIRPGKISKSKKPTVVELFSGCGGTSLGFEMADYEIAVGCDIHLPSIETFHANHPNSATILGDIKKVNPAAIKELLNNRGVDVLIGGVPCQGFSLNNRKRNENDERNMLYKEFIRFVKALNPKIVVLENVSGMKSTGDFVNIIEKELSEAGHMRVKSQLLFAPDYGVPQTRTRLVFIGVRDRGDFDFNKILKTHGPTTKKPYVTVKEAIGDLPSLQPGQVIDQYTNSPFSEYQRLMRQNSKSLLYNHKAPSHPSDVIKKIENTEPGKPMYPKFKQRIRLAWDMQSPTQVSGGIRPQFQFGHPSDSRGLTIRERCRLQSFPDNFIVCGGIVQGRVQTGNAVPPLLAKAIAESIKEYL
jgi:DNA (cytosine-5)-methyltransferase 1